MYVPGIGPSFFYCSKNSPLLFFISFNRPYITSSIEKHRFGKAIFIASSTDLPFTSLSLAPLAFPLNSIDLLRNTFHPG